MLTRRLLARLRTSAAPLGANRSVNGNAHWIAGAFMAWRADAFRALDGFDERYFLYCEDVDICLRLQLRGLRFEVVESACVVHDAQRASRGSPHHLVLHLKSLCALWASPTFWRFITSRPRPAADAISTRPT